MFESPSRLLLGLITGFVFGFFLQKGRVAKHDVIVGAFLLKDYTAVKIMATAVAVGSIGVLFLVQNGFANFHIKEAQIAGMVVGGLLFGIGVVLYGYCPGTGVAASGEGHKDAWMGVAGMICGAMVYVVSFPMIENLRGRYTNFGKATFPQMTESSAWWWVVGLVTIILSFVVVNRIKIRHIEGLRRKERFN